MAKYRKKPVVIEAVEFRLNQGIEDGTSNPTDLPAGVKPVGFEVNDPHNKLVYPYIDTMEGRHYINPGDYIITGVKGERYPCNPDIFEATYDKVD